MGNTLLEATDKYPLKQFDSWTEQKPELSGGKLLFESKIFYTMSFNLKNQNSSIIMKIYLKESDFDSKNSATYYEQFSYLKSRFNPLRYPNVLPFMTLMNFESHLLQQQTASSSPVNFVVVARQQMYQTLSERFLYKPSLNDKDKQWILFQTLIALHIVHKKEKLFHGAIRASNILLTSSNHVFLSDFANYKPLYIAEENQIRDLRFFYKTHENNSTLAPEKFQSGSTQQSILPLNNISPKLLSALQSMDIFSLGCVISDLYLDGEQPLFTYEQIQKFKIKSYNPESIIRKINNEKIRDLVYLIIMEPDCSKRIDIEMIITYFLQEVVQDKEKLMLLYCLDVAIQSNQMSKPDFRIAFILEMLKIIHKIIIKRESEDEVQEQISKFKFSLPLSIQKIDFMKKFKDSILNIDFNIWEIFNLEMPFYLKNQNQFSTSHKGVENSENLNVNEFRLCQNLFNIFKENQHFQQQQQKFSASSTSSQEKSQNKEDNPPSEDKSKVQSFSPELKIVVMLLCTNIRTVQFAASKLVGLEILVHLSQYLSDKDVLHIILPFICNQLEDFELQVAEYAFESFCKLLKRLKDPFESVNDTTLYKVFVWTNFQKCAKNMEIRRSFILNCIDLAYSCLSLCALSIQKKSEYLEYQYNISTSDILSRTQSIILNFKNEVQSPDKQEKEIEDLIKETFRKCLSDCPADISNLAISQLPKFFKFCRDPKEQTQYISLFISCLNVAERKLSCLESMFDIIVSISNEETKKFSILCLKDSLNDQNELFAYIALNCSWRLVDQGVLKTEQIYEFVEQISPMILHPHNWIRKEAIKFLEVVVTKIPPIQVFLQIQPRVISFLTEDVAILNKDILHLILPAKIDKNIVDFKNRKCLKYDKFEYPLQKQHIKLFQDSYLSRGKSSRDQVKTAKEEELRQFEKKFEIISSRQLQRQGFQKKITDFLTSAFKNNIFLYLSFASDKYRVNSQLDDKQLDKLTLEFFKEQRIPMDANGFGFEISSELQKFLNQMQMELSINFDSCIIKYGLFSNHHHKNFASSLVLLNEFILKLKQFEVLEDIDIGKPFFYDPAGVNQSQNSLKTWHPQGSIVTTIFEHSDVVSSLEPIQNNRHFISASFDGTVRIFDVASLEQDYTSDSVAQIICNDDKDVSGVSKHHKIKVVKMIPDSSSLLVGTEKGTIFLYNIEKCTDQKLVPDLRKRNLQTIYGSGEVRCLESFKNDTDKCFLYATSKGEVGVRDIRSKSIALSNSIGKERGLISSMVLAPGFSSLTTSTAVIGTLNGYCLMYDLRCNLLSHNYLLLNTEEQPLPIMSLSNFYRYSNVDVLGKQNELLAMSFVSDNHEVAMFNLNQMADSMNPSIYMLSTKNYNPTFQTPVLKLLSKQENLNYCNRNTLKDMMEYEFIPNFAQQVNALDYLTDPLIKNQNSIKLRLLEQSKNCFQNIQNVHTCSNFVSKILCLPSSSAYSSAVLSKTAQNSILTCGNDRNVRLWPMVSDPPSKSNYQIDSQIKGFHISNVDNHQRNFSQKKVANILVLHEYSRASFQQSTTYTQAAKKKSQFEEMNQSTFNPTDKCSAHADTITDMIHIEREQGALLITSSRDKTIKIWK